MLGEQRNCTAETLEKELENLTPICKIQSGIIRDIPDDLDHPANDNQQSAEEQDALTVRDRELLRALAGNTPVVKPSV